MAKLEVDPSDHHNQSLTESIEFNLIEFVNFIYSRRRGVLILSVCFSLAVATYFTAVKGDVYKAAGTININMSLKSDSFSMSRYSSWMEEQELMTKVYLTERFFESSRYRKAVIAEIEGKTKYCTDDICNELRETMQQYLTSKNATTFEEKLDVTFNMLSIRSDSARFILTIMATSENPRVAHAANTLAIQTLVSLNYEFLLTKNLRVREFLAEQTRSTNEYLSSLEKELVEEQKKHKLIATGETESRLTAIYIEQQQRLHGLGRDKMALDILEKEVLHQLKDYKQQVTSPDTVSTLYLSQLQKRFELLRYQMAVGGSEGRNPAGEQQASDAELRKYAEIFKSDKGNWVATDIWSHIEKAENFLVEIRQRREKITSEIQATKQAIEKWDVDYAGLPEVLRTLTEIKRNIQITTDVYSSLKTRLQEINIREAERANDLAVLALPDVPSGPVGLPYGKKLMLAAAAGPGLSVFLMLLNYVLVPLVRSVRDVESLGIKVLGRVTQFRQAGGSLVGRNYPQVFEIDSDAYQANSLRYIRFRLEHELAHTGNMDKGKVVAVTSFNPGEGKTFTCVNLAAAFSMSDIRVLIIDLDVRYSDLSLYFGEPHEVVEIGTTNEKLDFVLRTFQPNIHTLSVKTRDSDVRDYIQGKEFTSVLERLKSSYDFILVDTAPMDGNVEAYLMSGSADATIFMINHRSTLKEQVVQGIKSLREISHRPVFAVLNFSYEEGMKLLARRKKIPA